MQKRIEWIDISKTIGIMSIVLCHICLIHPLFKTLIPLICIYHVPIFFFIGGYLYKPADIKVYTKKKFKHLIVPYISSFITIMLIMIFIKKDESITLLEYIESLIYGIKDIDFCIWFLPSYFISSIVFNIIQQRSSFKVLCFISISVYIIYNIIYLMFTTKILSWSINILPLTTFFIFIGYLYRIYFENKQNWLIYILGLMAMLSSIMIIGNTFDLFKNYIGLPFITVICSILIIITINYISKLLSRTFLVKCLTIIGKPSIIIMVFHIPIYFIFMTFFNISFASNLSIIICTIGLIVIVSFLYHLFDKYSITRVLFLGKNKFN